MSTLDLADTTTIAALTEALTAAGVDGIEISTPKGHLRLVVATGNSAQAASVVKPSSAETAAAAVIVKAPMAGRFCSSHPSASVETDHLPRSITSADVLGFIRIGSVLLPVSAGRSGVVRKLLAEPDALVGFGDPLFEIEPQS
ncbi:acetyl-CoA carboxylase biotin carboxyl carrier protein [Agrobacterium tumefaciens]|uniref:acetyl-CoA carboxylase biotin carboxyl carrier protein n=1 Tax=Agrobacterium tumefaciens TaxID=358 RepID=UPI00157415CD|nr:acetyl-CoA carboxylase [Agrobacterium tumefaciens]WCK05137.1 acetyl-CoA carboxylase [Agrobacterium tumefaciens]